MTDFHIHTSLCDGASTTREMAETAYQKGFTALGFSGHSFIEYDNYCMTKENTAVYNTEIERLKAEYDGKMEIFRGIEQDYFSKMPTSGYDYVIGSLHSLSEDANESVDGSPEITKAIIENRFYGNFTKYAEEYYRLEADVVKKTDCDIIGHFDLVTKYNEVLGYEETDEYFCHAFCALDELLKYDRIFELNVGAMTRGYRKSPYPSVPILKRMCEKNAKIILNGDCHNKLFLGDFLDDIKELAKQIGFKSHFILTKDGFKETKL